MRVLFSHSIVSLWSAALVASCSTTSVDATGELDPVETAQAGVTIQTQTCDPVVQVYPVRGPHNHGFDSQADNSSLWTCNADRSNTDYIAPGGSQVHVGNDIWAARGTPVAAVSSGVVTLSGRAAEPGPGFRVVVRDDCGWFHFYYHLDSIASGVVNGVRVIAGQTIGAVGNTGSTSNRVIHLHYSLGRSGEFTPSEMIDPFPLLRLVESNVCGSASNQTSQVLAATDSGGLFHTLRPPTGLWTGFADVEQATSAVLSPVDTASVMVAGEQHALVTSGGELWHAIRRGNGPWTPFGNVEDFAGEIGTITRVAAAEVAGSLHVVTLTGQSVHHSIRSSNGAWTPLHSVEAFAGDLDDVLDLAAAGFATGELQVAVSTTSGRLLHTARAASGPWTGWGDVEAVAASDPGAPRSIAAANVAGLFHLVADYGAAGIRHNVRNRNGTWTPLLLISDFNGGTPASVRDIGAAGFGDAQLQVIVVSDTPLWHAVRRADGTWTPFGDIKAFAGNPGSIIRASIAGH